MFTVNPPIVPFFNSVYDYFSEKSHFPAFNVANRFTFEDN